MTTETITAPKEYFETEGKAWAWATRKHTLNADMVVDTKHTSTTWAWEIDRARGNPEPAADAAAGDGPA